LKLSLENLPWHDKEPTLELLEAQAIMGDGLWKEAATDFFAEKRGAEQTGGKVPMGIQKFINSLVDKRFKDAGWDGELGRFYKKDTWVRISFRHVSTIDADLLSAIKLWKKEGVEGLAIFYATSSFLRIISPRDANSLCSYEKLRIAALDLKNVVELPLFIGKMKPHSTLDPEVMDAIL
jgi:hypothetical protein